MGFHGFSRLQVGFSRFQVGFEGKSWLQVGFYSYRSVFHGSRLFFMFLWLQVWFYDSRWIFIVMNGPRLVSIQAERRRREVRR